MKNNLSLKIAPVDVPTALHTPIEQTVSTPVDPPNPSYFPLYANPQCADSDDVLTDADEPRVMRSHSVAFTAQFDQLLWNVYLQHLLLPTTKPFAGPLPPLGLVARVANDTVHALVRALAEAPAGAAPVFDAQGAFSPETLRARVHQPVVLLLIRRRLLDLCLAQRSQTVPPAVTTVQMATPAGHAPLGTTLVLGAPPFLGLGLRQLSISNLLLTEQNVAQYGGQNGAGALLARPMSGASSVRLQSSSLNLRKHSLTRNNSGTSWLHVGNLSSARPLGNPDLATSTDLLQLMTDFVPSAFVRTNSGLNVTGAGNAAAPASTAPKWGFNAMMLDYQTPPSSAKSSFSLGSTPPTQRDGLYMNTPGSAMSEYDDFGLGLPQTRPGRSFTGSLPKPLTINTDTPSFPSTFPVGGFQEGLSSPFVGLHEDNYFPHHSAGNLLPGLLSEPAIPESPVRDTSMAGAGDKINLQGQFSLSEKKRDSLKLKRGIH